MPNNYCKREDNPLVTVLMPVFNAEKYLGSAMESILSQTYTHFEFLIINDGSTDKTAQIIESYSDKRIRLIQNPRNLGLVKTLNIGIDLAKGKYIARMDADDICHAERLERQVEFLETHPKVVLIGSGYVMIDEFGNPVHIKRKPMDSIQVRWVSLFRTAIEHPVSTYKASLAKKIKYNENYDFAQDYDLWVRMLEHGDASILEDILLKYRMHDENISNTRKSLQRQMMKNISLKYVVSLWPGDKRVINQMAAFQNVFLMEKKADLTTIKSCFTFMDNLQSRFKVLYTLNSAHSFWIKKQAAGLLADGILKRGQALKQPRLFLGFLWLGRSYLLALLIRSIEIFVGNHRSLKQKDWSL